MASLLSDLPTNGLLSQISERVVQQQPSPRRHIQTRDAAEGERFQIVHTDKTNILIRSLQQKRKKYAGGANHSEVVSARAESSTFGDKGKKRACDDAESCPGDGVKRQLLSSLPSKAHCEGRTESGGGSSKNARSSPHEVHRTPKDLALLHASGATESGKGSAEDKVGASSTTATTSFG